MGTEPTLRFLPSREAPVQLELGGLHVHSRYPDREAKRQALALVASQPTLVLCFGPGLAYLVEALLRDTGVSVVWIEENDDIREAALTRLATTLNDLSLHEVDTSSRHRCWKGTDSNRLFLFSRTPALDELRQLFGAAIDSSPISTIRATLQPSYLTLIHQLERVAFRGAVNRNTLNRFDRLWVKNAYYNFRHAHHFQPVRNLFETFRDVPALIVAAGPSLDNALPTLQKFRSRFLLLAVDTALGPLAHAGIDPDFALSVDAQAANFLHARNYRGKARWVIDPTVSYMLLRELTSMRTTHGDILPIFVFENPLPLVSGLFNMIGPNSPGTIHSGGSVSTNAYDLALQMGCNPIYLCGLDLSFPGLRIHARGSALEEASHSRTSRLQSIEQMNYRQLTAIDRRFTPDCDGKPVATNDKLNVFAEWFESRFRRLPERQVVKNLYGGGVCFSHVESVSIAVFARELDSCIPSGKMPDSFDEPIVPDDTSRNATLPADRPPNNPTQTATLASRVRERLLATLNILDTVNVDSADLPTSLDAVASTLLREYPDIVRILSNGMQEALLTPSGSGERYRGSHENQNLHLFLRDLRQACSLHLSMLKD